MVLKPGTFDAADLCVASWWRNFVEAGLTWPIPETYRVSVKKRTFLLLIIFFNLSPAREKGDLLGLYACAKLLQLCLTFATL